MYLLEYNVVVIIQIDIHTVIKFWDEQVTSVVFTDVQLK